MTRFETEHWKFSGAVFKTRDVARVVSLSPRRVRRMVHAGFVRPRRDHRGEYRFSFQDIVFLRMSKVLLESGIARRRIRHSLLRLGRQIPVGRPVTSARLWAEGDRILARYGQVTWIPESGQILLNFGRSERASRIERPGFRAVP
jgi:hypothetical protein